MLSVLSSIFSNTSKVKPTGIHLRWFLPEGKGFPGGGFSVFRMKSKLLDDFSERFNFSNIRAGDLLKTGDRYGIATMQIRSGIVLTSQGNGSVALNVNGENFVEVLLSKPVTRFQIWYVTGTGMVKMEAFSGTRSVDVVTQPDDTVTTLSVRAPLIDRIRIRTSFKYWNEFGYFVIDDGRWELIKRIPFVDKEAIARSLVPGTITNAFADNQAEALQSCDIKELVRWNKLLYDRAPNVFTNPNANPDQLTIKHNYPFQKDKSFYLRLLPYVKLLSLNPNIAYMLGLYYADAYVSSGHPSDDQLYHYKITGHWKEGDDHGILFDVGDKLAGEPTVSHLKAHQKPGYTWNNRNPLGRVGLTWRVKREEEHVANAPMFFYLKDAKDGAQPAVVNKNPVLLARKLLADNNADKYIHREVALGIHKYDLYAVDVFGQAGPAVSSPGLEVKDIEAPPPAKNLRCQVLQEGYPWTETANRTQAVFDRPAHLSVSFEYGESQHSMAPDAKYLHLYSRNDRIVESSVVTIQVDSDQFAAGQHNYTLIVQPAVNLNRFLHGSLRKISNAINDRPAFRVRSIQAGKLVLEPSEHSIDPAAQYSLEADRYYLPNWTALKTNIAVKPPRSGLVSEIASLTAVVKEVRPSRTEVSPLSLLPASRRPKLDPPVIYTEILLSIGLLESELFKAGKAVIAGVEHAVLDSIAGIGYDSDADPSHRYTSKILVAGVLNVAVGASVTLIKSAATEDDFLIQQIRVNTTLTAFERNSNGGEIAFDHVQSNGQTTSVVLRVISIASESANAFHIGIKIPFRHRNKLQLNRSTVRYYAPYRFDFDVNINQVAGWPASTINFPIPSSVPTRSMFLAVCASDDRNIRGSLSQVNQAEFVSTPVLITPECPFAKGGNLATQKSWASMPDLAGNSDIALQWNAGAFAAINGAEFQLARAMDSTIIAADLKAWILGKSVAGFNPVNVQVSAIAETAQMYQCTIQHAAPAQIDDSYSEGLLVQQSLILPVTSLLLASSTQTRLTCTNTQTGLQNGPAIFYRVRVLPGNPHLNLIITNVEATNLADTFRVRVNGLAASFQHTAAMKTLVNGRIEIRRAAGGTLFGKITSGTVQGAHSIITIKLPGAGNISVADNNSAASIITAPDYSLANSSDKNLRLLAGKPGNRDAFGIVTNVPVSGTQYKDVIRGKGNNRFFYKLRGVFPNKDFSEWSACSAAFYLSDTSHPEPPSPFFLLQSWGKIILCWNDLQPLINDYILYRGINGAEPAVLRQFTRAQTSAQPLIASAGYLSLPVRVNDVVSDVLTDDQIHAHLLSRLSVEYRNNPAAGNILNAARAKISFTKEAPVNNQVQLTLVAIDGIDDNDLLDPLLIRYGATLIDANPFVRCIEDTTVIPATEYGYRLVAIKKLTHAKEGFPGQETQVNIRSRLSILIKGKAL
jgi:hypothetical protein